MFQPRCRIPSLPPLTPSFSPTTANLDPLETSYVGSLPPSHQLPLSPYYGKADPPETIYGGSSGVLGSGVKLHAAGIDFCCILSRRRETLLAMRNYSDRVISRTTPRSPSPGGCRMQPGANVAAGPEELSHHCGLTPSETALNDPPTAEH